MSGYMCLTKCWGCKFGQCDETWHTWADEEDIAFALANGQPDPSSQQCNCSCQTGISACRPIGASQGAPDANMADNP